MHSKQLYKAWGEPRYASASLPTQYTYTGEYSYTDDLATPGTSEGFGLMFYQARWFDPTLGRWSQPDSLVPLASQGVQAWDRYAYTNNNPLKYIDPSGHDVGCGGRDASECVNPYVRTKSILLKGGPGAANYGTIAEDSYTGYSTAGDSPQAAWVNIPSLFNDTLVWIRDNTNIKSLLGNDPEVSGMVYYQQRAYGTIITGVGITNTSEEPIGITNVAISNYSIDDNSLISHIVLYPYSYTSIVGRNYGIAMPGSTSNTVRLTFIVDPRNYAEVQISVLSQSGRWGILRSSISNTP